MSKDQKLRELHAAVEDLMQIVEGVRSERWVGERGQRLKDTPEWARLYVARCAVNREADGPDFAAIDARLAEKSAQCGPISDY